MSSAQKRILIFSLAYVPRASGAELAVKEITDRLPAESFSFDMLTLRFSRAHKRHEIIGAITVHRIGFGTGWYIEKMLFPLMAAYKALMLHRSRQFTVLWSLMTYMGFPAVLFCLFNKDVPFLLTLQDGDTLEQIRDRKRIRIVAPLFKRIFRDARAIQCISHFLADFGQSMGATCPIVVIPNGVDSTFWQRERTRYDPARLLDAGVPPRSFRLITASRLVHKNGIDIVLKTLSLLPRSTVFIIAGGGSDEPSLRALAEELGVADRVFFLGHVAFEELPELFAYSDVFIRLSRSEGLGTAFLEAMAAKLPVVATSVGGIPDIVRDGETGFLAEPDNPASAAEAIARAGNKREARPIILRAQKMVEARYNWDMIAREMEDTFFGTA